MLLSSCTPRGLPSRWLCAGRRMAGGRQYGKAGWRGFDQPQMGNPGLEALYLSLNYQPRRPMPQHAEPNKYLVGRAIQALLLIVTLGACGKVSLTDTPREHLQMDSKRLANGFHLDIKVNAARKIVMLRFTNYSNQRTRLYVGRFAFKFFLLISGEIRRAIDKDTFVTMIYDPTEALPGGSANVIFLEVGESAEVRLDIPTLYFESVSEFPILAEIGKGENDAVLILKYIVLPMLWQDGKYVPFKSVSEELLRLPVSLQNRQ